MFRGAAVTLLLLGSAGPVFASDCGETVEIYQAVDRNIQTVAGQVDGLPIDLGTDAPSSVGRRMSDTRDRLVIELHNFDRQLQDAIAMLRECQ